MNIQIVGDPADFRDVVAGKILAASSMLDTDEYVDGITSAMQYGQYTANSAAGWCYVADGRQLPEGGIITPEVLDELVTAVGTWFFDGFEGDGHPLGYAYNAIGKVLWSLRNEWRSTLHLREVANHLAGGDAGDGALVTIGMIESTEQLITSQSRLNRNHRLGFFPYGGCTGIDAKKNIFDVGATSGWSQFEDHVEAERVRRAMRELLAA